MALSTRTSEFHRMESVWRYRSRKTNSNTASLYVVHIYGYAVYQALRFFFISFVS